MASEMLSLRSVLEGNLNDKLAARHLLLVCSGGTETAVGLLQDVAQRQDRKIHIMVGSAFDEDKSATWSTLGVVGSVSFCVVLPPRNASRTVEHVAGFVLIRNLLLSIEPSRTGMPSAC